MGEKSNRMLIVSNNPLSETQNNGKTIASFIEGIPKERVHQLYFSSENPSIKGYSYFQLSDIDVLHGICNKNKRGRVWKECISQSDVSDNNKSIKKNAFTSILREFLWTGKWKSFQLIEWLDEFRPDVIFFVAGDSGFAYNIVKFIANRYKSRVITYITDDYIMPRSKESIVEKFIRMNIRKKMTTCIKKSQDYFTISEPMKEAYFSLSGKKSRLLMNITPSLKDEKSDDSRNVNNITAIYTGSLYYNRDKILGMIADAALQYNSQFSNFEKKIIIKVYSNDEPEKKRKRIFEREGCCVFCGSLGKNEVKKVLNKADILLFVEAFNPEIQEKTKYSLSTKVPEYMSIGKPIFAIGPENIGSMKYLRDVAFCAFSETDIYKVMTEMLLSDKKMMEIAEAAREKFEQLHDPQKARKIFRMVCGMDI